jgi:hypothetical protein
MNIVGVVAIASVLLLIGVGFYYAPEIVLLASMLIPVAYMATKG